MVDKAQEKPEKATKQEEEIKLSIDMEKEDLLAAALKLKKEKERADKKNSKLEERFLSVVKERNAGQATLKKQMKLVEANETTMQSMEEELETAVKCLQLIFGPKSEEQFLDEDRIDYEKVRVLYTEMKKAEKEKLATAKASNQPANDNVEADDLDH